MIFSCQWHNNKKTITTGLLFSRPLTFSMSLEKISVKLKETEPKCYGFPCLSLFETKHHHFERTVTEFKSTSWIKVETDTRRDTKRKTHHEVLLIKRDWQSCGDITYLKTFLRHSCCGFIKKVLWQEMEVGMKKTVGYEECCLENTSTLLGHHDPWRASFPLIPVDSLCVCHCLQFLLYCLCPLTTKGKKGSNLGQADIFDYVLDGDPFPASKSLDAWVQGYRYSKKGDTDAPPRIQTTFEDTFEETFTTTKRKYTSFAERMSLRFCLLSSLFASSLCCCCFSFLVSLAFILQAVSVRNEDCRCIFTPWQLMACE